MADGNKIIPGIIIGLVVAFAGQAFKSWMDRPASLSADVMATAYTPPVGQSPGTATCLLSINVENNTSKPVRQIQVLADYAVAYSLPPLKKGITTGSISKDPVPYVIDVINPGSSRRMFVFTAYPCAASELFGHPGVRIFNDEGSATIRNIVPPDWWLMIYVNQYYFVSLPLMGVGALLFLLIITAGVVDGFKKLNASSKSKPPDTPAAPA